MEHISKPMSRIKRRLTQKEIAQNIQMFAPEGCKLPEWVDRAASRKTGGARGNPEEDIQREVCEYLEKLPGTLFFAIPNHLYLGRGDWGKKAWYIEKQKRLGLVVGASDLCILFRNIHGAPVTVFAELKAGNNTASDAQQAFLDKANALGAYTGIVKSRHQMMDLLRVAGHPNAKGSGSAS